MDRRQSTDPRKRNAIILWIIALLMMTGFTLVLWRGNILPYQSKNNDSPLLHQAVDSVQAGESISLSTDDNRWSIVIPADLLKPGLVIYLTSRESDLFGSETETDLRRPYVVHFQIMDGDRQLSQDIGQSLKLCLHIDDSDWERYLHSPNSFIFQGFDKPGDLILFQ